MLNKAKKLFLNDFVDKKIRNITYSLPIQETNEEDFFIVGFPKSGNTWFQYIVSNVLYGVNICAANDTLVQDLVPDIHYKKYYRRYSEKMFFKSHSLPKKEYRNVVYLVRDGRDVIVSYYYHLRAMGENVYYEDLLNGNYGDWNEHVEQWLSNPFNSNMLVIKYEDLKKQPIVELEKFCQFINVEKNLSQLEETVQLTSFHTMKMLEMKHGFDNKLWPRNSNFIRQGEVGGYKKELPEDFLLSLSEKYYSTLLKLGYLK